MATPEVVSVTHALSATLWRHSVTLAQAQAQARFSSGAMIAVGLLDWPLYEEPECEADEDASRPREVADAYDRHHPVGIPPPSQKHLTLSPIRVLIVRGRLQIGNEHDDGGKKEANKEHPWPVPESGASHGSKQHGNRQRTA